MKSLLIRSIRVNVRSVLQYANFYIAIVLLFGSLFMESVEDIPIRLNNDITALDSTIWGSAYAFNISLHFGLYIYVAPLACAFAAAGLFCNDSEAGFYRLRLLKSGKNAYQYGLFLGGSIGGGLSLMIGVLLYAGFCSVLYLPLNVTDMSVADAWMPIISSSGGYWKYMLANAGLAFLFGLIWSGVGLTISVLSPTRYVCYLSPFIICFCSVIVLPPSLQPLEMLVQMDWGNFTFTKLFLYQAVLYFAIMIAFVFSMERRVLRA